MRDRATGQREAICVSTTLMHHAGSVIAVTLTDPQTHQQETLTASPEHPFFVLGHGFVSASRRIARCFIILDLSSR